MTITTDLDTWWGDLSDYQESNAAKAAVQDMVNTVQQMVSDLATMNANGDFDELPPSAKAAAIWIWQKYNAANNAVEADADAQEFLSWTP